jgi:uncharacterized membrane protein
MDVPALPFTLSPQVFLVVFALGAAVIAMWVHLKAPTLGPGDVRGVTLHLVLAVLGVNLLVPYVFRLAESSTGVLAATFAVVLPGLVYMFLAGIWLIRLGQGVLSRYSR